MRMPSSTAETRVAIVHEYRRLISEGYPDYRAALAVGKSVQTLKKWLAAYESSGLAGLDPARSTGRPPACEPTAEDLQKLRAVYMRTNRNRKDGSKILAARLLARAGELSPAVAEAILAPRVGKTLPKALRDAMCVPPDVIAHHRSPKNAILGGFYIPGHLRMAEGEEGGARRLHAGERQSWDDATINFGVVAPWPWGGCPCSDKYGVKLGRFQLLTCVDDASSFCPGYSYVIRAQQSYRAEDTVAAQFRMGRDGYAPKRYMIEGGVWQSDRAKAFYRAAGIGTDSAKGRPHSKLVEIHFNRLWSALALAPGDVGRYRGEMELMNKRYIQCRQGRADPREWFPLLSQALADLDGATAFVNSEPMVSNRYGTWIPRERHAEDLALHPRPSLDRGLAYLAAPLVEKRVIRRGMVRIKCISPFGESMPYHFADPEMIPFDGCRAVVYFDPDDTPLRATVALAQDAHGYKAGHVIAPCAMCIDDAPEVLATLDGLRVDLGEGALQRGIVMRKRIHQAIRREHRALDWSGNLLRSASEARDGKGNAACVEVDAQQFSQGGPAAAEQTPDDRVFLLSPGARGPAASAALGTDGRMPRGRGLLDKSQPARLGRIKTAAELVGM